MTHSKFPGLRWDAEGNVHHCETEDDVQPGWTDYHPDSAPQDKRPAAVVRNDGKSDVEAETSMSRDEIIAALQEGGIDFKKNAPTAALARHLRVEVLSALEELDVAYPHGAPTKSLLALIPAPE